jgi:general stress protein 26
MTGIRLDDNEAWDLIESARIGIFTSLRRSGEPISLPVWFAALDRRIYLRGPARAKKFARVANDARVSFLVEEGERWQDLRAVHLSGIARIVGDEPELLERFESEMDRRYDALRPTTSGFHESTGDRYRSMRVIEISPGPHVLSWNNSKIGLEEP